MIDMPMKRCTKCGKEKPLSDFCKDKSRKDGRQLHCKTCNADYRRVNRKRITAYLCANKDRTTERLRQWKISNRERIRQYDREWRRQNLEHVRQSACVRREQNRERIRQLERARRAKNGERVRQVQRLWYKKNIEKINQRRRERRAKNHAHIRQITRAWREKNREHVRRSGLISGHRYNARKRNLPNTLTVEQWQRCLDYFQHRCAACRRPKGLWHKIVPDHWIPLASSECLGTTALNIIPLCHGDGGCNNSKQDTNAELWLSWKFGAAQAAEILSRINTYFEWVKANEA